MVFKGLTLPNVSPPFLTLFLRVMESSTVVGVVLVKLLLVLQKQECPEVNL